MTYLNHASSTIHPLYSINEPHAKTQPSLAKILVKIIEISSLPKLPAPSHITVSIQTPIGKLVDPYNGIEIIKKII
jgi:hypothetical protein